jgi:hypothetical protein
VVVSALLSLSSTETPAIGDVVSSSTVCPPGTVLTGASLMATTVTSEVAGWLLFRPSLTAT